MIVQKEFNCTYATSNFLHATRPINSTNITDKPIYIYNIKLTKQLPRQNICTVFRQYVISYVALICIVYQISCHIPQIHRQFPFFSCELLSAHAACATRKTFYHSLFAYTCGMQQWVIFVIKKINLVVLAYCRLQDSHFPALGKFHYFSMAFPGF